MLVCSAGWVHIGCDSTVAFLYLTFIQTDAARTCGALIVTAALPAAAQVAALSRSNVVVMYASAYGNTAALAQAISRGLTKGGVGVSTVNLELTPLDEVVTNIKDADGFTIGSPTLGGHMPTPVQVRRCVGLMRFCVLADVHGRCVVWLAVCNWHESARTWEMFMSGRFAGCLSLTLHAALLLLLLLLPPYHSPPPPVGAGLHPARVQGSRAAVRRVWQLWLVWRGC
jgi:hypothetical protein